MICALEQPEFKAGHLVFHLLVFADVRSQENVLDGFGDLSCGPNFLFPLAIWPFWKEIGRMLLDREEIFSLLLVVMMLLIQSDWCQYGFNL